MSKSKNDAVKKNGAKKTTEAVKKNQVTAQKGTRGKVSQWFSDLKSELKKVVWPTRQQTTNGTLVTIMTTIVSALLLWGFDTLAQSGVSALISVVG